MQTRQVHFPHPRGNVLLKHTNNQLEDSFWYVIETPTVIVVIETNKNKGISIVNGIDYFYQKAITEKPTLKEKLWIIGNLNFYGEPEAAEYSLWTPDKPAFSYLSYDQAVKVSGYALPKMRGDFEFN
jgi:hypothetical protein